jgi:integrase
VDLRGLYYYKYYTMAFIFRRPHSRYWHAGFIDKNGKRRNASTGVTGAKEAQKIANAYEEAANKRRTAKQVRDVISELHKEITGEDLASQSFKAFSETWLTRKEPEVAPATLVFYKNALGKFSVFLGEKANEEMTAITQDDITRFRNQEAKTLSSKTVNHDLKCLKMLFKSARRDRVISDDPSEFVKTAKKTQSTTRRPFTTGELERVLAAADDEWQSLIRFGLYTGQRLGDLAALTWQNVDLQRAELRITTQKTSKSLILPIPSHLLARLKEAPGSKLPEDPIHPSAYKAWKQSGKTATISNQFVNLLTRTGLREKKPHRKSASAPGRGVGSSSGGLSFHCLRHTAVSMMKDAGVPEAAVMELVGHDSEQMSAHYTHVGTEALKKASASLPVL